MIILHIYAASVTSRNDEYTDSDGDTCFVTIVRILGIVN